MTAPSPVVGDLSNRRNEEGRPVHQAASASSVILETTVSRGTDSQPTPRPVVPFVARGVQQDSDARLAGELASARVAELESRVRTPASLSASRAAWLHLRFCGLVDDEGFVDGILRNLGEAS